MARLTEFLRAHSRLLLSVVASLVLHGMFLLNGYGVPVASGSKPSAAIPLHVVQLGSRPEPPPESTPLPATSAVVPREAESRIGETKPSASRQVKASQLPLPLPPIHFHTRAELNRFPVLLNPLPVNAEAFAEFGLSAAGRAVLVVFIGKDGLVVDVEVDAGATNLPPAVVARVRRQMLDARFMPGYLLGDPVPSQVRWEFALRPSGIHGSQVSSGEAR